MIRLFRPASLLLLFLAVSSVAQAQWLVYELRFKEEAGSVNFSFYTGAYVVAPIQGGSASIIFTTESGGNYYASAENAMRYYMAANQGVRQAVLSAFTINGTAQAFYSASGFLTTTMSYTEEGVARTMSVPASLSGMLLASDDESFLTPASDGSLGMIGRASIAGTLRRDLTEVTNQSAITMHDAVTSIVTLLEKYGYRPDEGDVGATASDAPATVTEDETTPENADVSALFGAQQEQQTTAAVEEPAPSVAVQSSLFPSIREDEQ